MLAAERRAHILAELERSGTVRVSDLVAELGVSDMTVRRDLDLLQGEGLLEKVHGGAVARTAPSTAEPGFEAKSERQLSEKEAIAAYAASLVQPGSAIAVSAGTTTHLLAKHLARIAGLTVVTNSVWVADVLHRSLQSQQSQQSQQSSMSVLLTGGLRTPSDALVGPIAISALRSLHLDAVFMGVHGMDPRAGFSTPNLLEAETNRAMVGAGRRLVVVADSTKWGVVGLSSMATLAEAAIVVTDSGLPDHAVSVLGEQVGELVRVPAEVASATSLPPL